MNRASVARFDRGIVELGFRKVTHGPTMVSIWNSGLFSDGMLWFFTRAEYSGDTVSIQRESKGEDNCQVAGSFSDAK